MLGNLEVSQDVAWGTHDLEQWQKTFEQLFEKTHRLRDEALTAYYEQKDIKRTLAREIARMRQMASPQQHFTAWIELDVVVEAAGDVALEVHYTCPNAMCRPQHRASLSEDGQIAFETQAVLWQNTGEDWSKINLTCSTAKSSLGIEPPLLDDDYLNAQRKSEHLVIEAREALALVLHLDPGAGDPGLPLSQAQVSPGHHSVAEHRAAASLIVERPS